VLGTVHFVMTWAFERFSAGRAKASVARARVRSDRATITARRGDECGRRGNFERNKVWPAKFASSNSPAISGSLHGYPACSLMVCKQ
jgi:hypothetical protein